jgi:hypothetical protein
MNDSCAESARRAPIALFHESRMDPFFSRTKPQRVLRGLNFLNRQFQISVLCHSEERSDEESAPAGETKNRSRSFAALRMTKRRKAKGYRRGQSLEMGLMRMKCQGQVRRQWSDSGSQKGPWRPMREKMPAISSGAGRRDSGVRRFSYQVVARCQSWSRETVGRRSNPLRPANS